MGFELEVGNVAVREVASACHRCFGGELTELNPFVVELRGSDLGTLKIERDAELLASTKYRKALEVLDIDFDADSLASEIEHGVDRLASVLVPCEIVTAPLTFDQFPEVDRIVTLLDDLDAKGTDESLLYAFGLHLNPSAPRLEVGSVATYLRAFLLLESWIIADAEVDITRRHLTRFIDPFPDEFVDTLLDPDYPAHDEEFFDGYLEHNPTRNRSLDLLPVLAEIDEERVMAAVDPDERSLIGPRPAFHYRLPDCRPGDPEWSIASEWNRWWCVEMIATDADQLNGLLDLWQHNQEGLSLTRKARWIETVGSFIEAELDLPGSGRP